ncbi:hypothetical protein BDZ97DRAFT_2078518 [Flammula alnicola]|nr:hypothetical protein BDZ97DRAFT_2078518 [Flammula alnicola]
MASKQLGRLRQWAGEVISSREKISVNEEFKELEKDIELRKDGIQRLITASGAYHHALSKKKANEALNEGEKMLPIDILGVVMIVHGEEFGEESPFGNSLVKLGRAHCKIATLQEAYALTFKDTFLTSMDRFKDEIKEYEQLRKKLENRRQISDTATAKFEKLQNSKKEKDKREAEDEMDRAKQRYEETAEDLRAHMHAIQENEHNQLHDLTSLLDLETNFIQSYLDVLKDVKADWQDRSDSQPRSRTKVDGQIHTSRPASKASFIHPNGRDRANSTVSVVDADSSDDDASTTGQALSNKHTRSGSNGSRPPSRPSSRLSRKRTNSSAATSNATSDEKEKEKEKEKEVSGRPRKMSVAGWASSAVESVTGSRSKKSKDKDSFATLDDTAAAKTVAEQQGDGAHMIRKSSSFRSLGRRSSNKSKENLPANSPVGPPRILKPPSLQNNKVVRALYDFSGSSDELSFKAGSDIVVVHEVLDDWWMGELNGQRGLFPTSYTEVIPSKPPVPTRSYKNSPGLSNDHDSDHLTSDVDEEQVLHAVPMAVNRSPIFYGRFDDSASMTDSVADSLVDEEDRKSHPITMPQRMPFFEDWSEPTLTIRSTPRRSVLNSLDPAQQPLINPAASLGTLTTPTKKIPPPPPPRRTVSHNPSSGPPIPERKAPSFVSSHASSGSLSNLTPASSLSGNGHGYDRSPFESAIELDGASVAKCEQFRQNPFKPKGMCSNCLEFHD